MAHDLRSNLSDSQPHDGCRRDRGVSRPVGAAVTAVIRCGVATVESNEASGTDSPC